MARAGRAADLVTAGRRTRAAGAALLVLAGARGAGAHDVHVSHTRAVVEGSRVVLNVRLFADDLEATLRRTSGSAALRLETAAGDSAFARYLARQVTVSADGARLAPRVTSAGTANDATGIPMRWYLVELAAARPVRALAIRNALLFDAFRDQQNIVAVMRMPGERRTTLFFASGDDGAQTVPR